MLRSFVACLIASSLIGCVSVQSKEPDVPCGTIELYWEMCDLAGEPMACLNEAETKRLKEHMIRCEGGR